ncbi:MAG: SLBB domain-containing protein [bacterium]|nr:SLBB domain-containing protein [bacterium]
MVVFIHFLLLQVQPSVVKYYTYLSETGELQMKVSIWGEVMAPGLYSVPEGTDLVTLLTIAGGPSREADLSKIKVVRSFPSPSVFNLNLNNFFKTGNRENVTALKPGDMVYIKESPYYRIKESVRAFTEVTFIVGAYYQLYHILRYGR